MRTYTVVFSMPYGSFLRLEMQWESKHKSESDFNLDIENLAKKLGVIYLYREEKE